MTDPDHRTREDNDDEYYIDESAFVDHLQRVHHIETRSLESALNSLKIIGLYEEREVQTTNKTNV